MNEQIGMVSLDSLKSSDLKGKTIFIRCDFNVPLVATEKGYYRVADDTRIRRFLDTTFKKLHELTDGDCRIIIGSHLGRPHKQKGHMGWDGIFNIQFVSSHFDTLIRQLHGDTYTIFPPEIIDSHMKHSLEIASHKRLPPGGIKFLPNLRYLLDPSNPDAYRKEFIDELAKVSDVYINCAFGCSHRVTKSIKMLPQRMRAQKKLVVAGVLLHQEIKNLGNFGRKVINHPGKTVVIAGGAKVSDKIAILKQFVRTGVKAIFIGGKMVNAFLLAQQEKSKIKPFQLKDLPATLLSKSDESNQNLVSEVHLAEEITDLAQQKGVELLLPEDYKCVAEYKAPTYYVKDCPDFNKELQLDLGPKTIDSFSQKILDGVENVFWNGPLGAYDHPSSHDYAEGSLELAQLLFGAALMNQNLSVVIGGGDSAAILNKIGINQLKKLVRGRIEIQLAEPINRNLLSMEFQVNDSYVLWNYLTANFFVSTGGGAALEFLEKFFNREGKDDLASYLPGTSTLMELAAA
ncbi:phosphoglycerate kinase [Candidatus Nitromaritima sp. SCGC AAA799-A02]|nr:phosphoglycerate kinase [Candidatus Nitromaritima sp. SCGC AAA799-A02]